MERFYTSAESQISHVEGIEVVRGVVQALHEQIPDPAAICVRDTDFFGAPLDKSDSTLARLTEPPPGEGELAFIGMVSALLQSTITVLERQYQKYFAMDVTDQLRLESESARCHNIDAEEIMGMFSALKNKAPNATVCYLASKMRAQKNKTVDYLDSMPPVALDDVLKAVVSLARQKRNKRRKRQKDLLKEMAARQAAKQQQRDAAQRKKLERELKSLETTESGISGKFPEMEEDKRENLLKILDGRAVGSHVCHVWSTDGGLLHTYLGKIEKLKKTKTTQKYRVGYWEQHETYDNAVDYDMPLQELAADFVLGDLIM